MQSTLERGKILSLPNIISLSRVALAGAFIAVEERWARVALIAIASLTDFLDGWIARRFRSASRSGALIDPIADRFFALTAISTFLFAGLLTTGQYFILLSRDLATAVGFLVARVISWLRPVVFKARWSGKLVTVGQLAALAAVLLYPPAVEPLVILVGVVSAYSIFDYTLALWRARVPAS